MHRPSTLYIFVGQGGGRDYDDWSIYWSAAVAALSFVDLKFSCSKMGSKALSCSKRIFPTDHISGHRQMLSTEPCQRILPILCGETGELLCCDDGPQWGSHGSRRFRGTPPHQRDCFFSLNHYEVFTAFLVSFLDSGGSCSCDSRWNHIETTCAPVRKGHEDGILPSKPIAIKVICWITSQRLFRLWSPHPIWLLPGYRRQSWEPVSRSSLFASLPCSCSSLQIVGGQSLKVWFCQL